MTINTCIKFSPSFIFHMFRRPPVNYYQTRSFFWSLLIFGGLYQMSWLRVDPDLELKGMDIIKHGEAAYPAQVTA